jgi:hypothetical protein
LSVVLVSGVLILEIPDIALTNCTQFQIRIAQAIPAGITADTTVSIRTTSGLPFPLLNPCCANNVYADQIRRCGFYFVRFGSDTGNFILAGGWRLCRTSHVFDVVIPVILSSTTTTKSTKKVEVKKDE